MMVLIDLALLKRLRGHLTLCVKHPERHEAVRADCQLLDEVIAPASSTSKGWEGGANTPQRHEPEKPGDIE